MLGRVQIESDLQPQHQLPAGMSEVLMQRNGKPGTFDANPATFVKWKFDPKIVLADSSEDLGGNRFQDVFTKKFPTARGWVEPWLPGYSKDGTLALVRGWLGPTPHGAVFTTLLERKGDRWVVKWHSISYFL